MKEVSKTCDLKTLKDSPNATSSQASAYGHMPCEKQDGQTIDPCGQEVALASLSARQAKERGLLTSGTYGPRSTTLSASVNLSRSLASKLRVKTDANGSTLYKLTWKEWTTPAGRLIPALRASVLRTSDKDCTGLPLAGWRNPIASDGVGGATDPIKEIQKAQAKGTSPKLKLRDQVHLTGWPTPCASKTGKNSKDPQRMKEKGCQSCLGDAAHLTIDTPARLTASGDLLTGSSAGMESGGQLNPSLSRWLMGLPIDWDIAALKVDTHLIRSKKKRRTE